MPRQHSLRTRSNRDSTPSAENARDPQQLPPRVWPSCADNPLQGLTGTDALSMSCYPLPQGNPLPTALVPMPFYGGLLLEDSNDEQGAASSLSTRTSPKDRKVNTSSIAASSINKRGRPRKLLLHAAETDMAERRRLQTRAAQRTYQCRKDAQMSALKIRVSELSISVQRMSAAVFAFRDTLVQSGVLTSQPDVDVHLQDTVKICQILAKDATDKGHPGFTGPNASPYTDRPLFRAASLAPLASADPTKVLASLETPIVDLPTFIERLHKTCFYSGFRRLSDPMINLDTLQTQFRFMLAILDRKKLASYFEAVFLARTQHTGLEEWSEIPFFSLGGAGTHYRRCTTRFSSSWGQHTSHRERTTVKNPLSMLSPAIREELSGDWFDICDLEEYLREKGVRLLATKPDLGDCKNGAPTVNAAELLSTLQRKAMCLGRAPGFRRADVEVALLGSMTEYRA